MIRAGVVGLGWWGRHIVRSTRGSELLSVVKVVDQSPAQADFAQEHGLPFGAALVELTANPDIDAVILCTPHSLHAGQVLQVAGAGKHVFCEKPLALTQADAARSLAACQAAGVVLGVGHERRFEPAYAEVKRLVREGSLGTIMHAEANFSHDKLAGLPESDWRMSATDAPAGAMTAMGIHLTDAFIDLLGPVAEVYASTTSRVAYPRTGDVLSAHLRFTSGATAYLNAILVTPTYIGLTAFGSKAWVEVRNHTHPDTPGPTTLTLQRNDGSREVREYAWTDTVRANLEAFARAVEGTEPYPITDEQKLGNIATLEAICRSAETGRPTAVAHTAPAP
jgi:predicted dehydrogenase